MTPRLRRQRARLLIEQDGKCCYCEVRMRLAVVPDGERVPPEQCTLEHLYPRGDPRRGSPNSHKLACFKCNNERGLEHGRGLMPAHKFFQELADELNRRVQALPTAAERWAFIDGVNRMFGGPGIEYPKEKPPAPKHRGRRG